MKQRNCDHIFQHGNVGCHVARVCQDFLTQNHIRVLPWPALWPPPSKSTGNTTRAAFLHVWNNTTQAFIQRLIGSVLRRCEAVVAARGGHTRYWALQNTMLNDIVCLLMFCSDCDVKKFCWYFLICYAHISKLYYIGRFFSLCKQNWASNPCIVSFADYYINTLFYSITIGYWVLIVTLGYLSVKKKNKWRGKVRTVINNWSE